MDKRLVILPGWGFSSTVLQPLADELQYALAGFTVQLQPLPQMAGLNLEVVLAQLDQQLPEHCWLLGWSLGGMLATTLAARRVERCPGVISYASNACFVARAGWSEAMPASTFSEFYRLCSEDLQAGIKRFALLCSQGAEHARQLSRELYGLTQTSKDSLAGLDCLAELDTRSAISRFTGAQLHMLAQNDALVPASVAA